MNYFIQHFPRTGGSSLRTALEFPESGSSRFLYSGGPKDENKLYDLITKSKITDPILLSHFLFGIPNDILKAKYYTILRNPIHMAISLWILHYNNKNEHSHKQAIENNISGFLLATTNNPFCRCLLGSAENGIGLYRKQLVDSDVDRCLDILSTYDLVGDYDQYDDFIQKLSEKIDFKIELYKIKFTQSEYFPIERKEYDRLMDILRFDCAIYEKMFNKTVTHKYFKD